MTTVGPRKPQVATCEDCDDDNETTLAGTRPSANVARKRSQSDDLISKPRDDGKCQDGSDSGYSSKAGTNDSVSPTRKKVTDLKINTNVTMDRERQPYLHRPSRPEPTRQPSVKKNTKEKVIKKQEKQEPFKHAPQENCWTCITYGYHVDNLLPPPTANAPPSSPKVVKPSGQKPKHEETNRPKPRTQSATHPKRPLQVHTIIPQPQPQYTGYAAPQQVGYAHPGPHYGYHTPITPTTVSSPFHQQYATNTPLSTTFPDPQTYFDPRMTHHDPYQTSQYSTSYTSYGEPIITQYNQIPPQQGQPIQPQPQPQPQQPQQRQLLERQPSQRSRPRPAPQKSSQTNDDDRKIMPPPAWKPEPSQQNRSAVKRTTTEYSTRRQSVRLEEDERPEIPTKRMSRDSTGYAAPPSSWKASAVIDSQDRPRARKAASYSEGSDTVHVASSRDPIPRRTTVPSDHLDPIKQTIADAEAYQSQINKGRSNTLTAESLKRHTSQKSPASDAGTHRSKDSQRSKRASTVTSQSGATRITVEGGVSIEIPSGFDGQPIDVKVGNLNITMNAPEASRREQKRIEKAPSVSSQTSRKSPTNVSVSEGPTLTRQTSRRSTQSDQAKNSANSSRRTSRAPSSTRAAVDNSRKKESESRRVEDYYTEWGA